MKTNEKKELAEKTIQELQVLLKEAKDRLFVLHLQKSQFKLKNVRSLFWKRKEIALLMTVIQGKERVLIA